MRSNYSLCVRLQIVANDTPSRTTPQSSPPQETLEKRLQTRTNLEKQLAHAHGPERPQLQQFGQLTQHTAAVYVTPKRPTKEKGAANWQAP